MQMEAFTPIPSWLGEATDLLSPLLGELEVSVQVFGVLVLCRVSLATGAFEKAELWEQNGDWRVISKASINSFQQPTERGGCYSL